MADVVCIKTKGPYEAPAAEEQEVPIVNTYLIAALEQLLAMAKEGKLLTILAAGLDGDGDPVVVLDWSWTDRALALGAFEIAKHSYLNPPQGSGRSAG